ncbi:MAG: site-2 protease family protein [Clostridia bacterium]|nr:site-2 protease family protein [Clostridia bacterium]
MKNKRALGGLRRVNISVYFAVFIACLLVLDHTGLVVYALVCVGVHELGHIAAIRLYRAPVEEISFRLFGVGIRLRNNVRLGYRQELVVALAGCAANLLLCAAAWICARVGFYALQASLLLVFSLMIGAFNILPICPLDGGRALETLLSMRLPPEKVQRIVDIVSLVLIVPLATAGFRLLIWTGCNFSLLLVAVYLAAMLVLKGRRGAVVSRNK